MAPCSTPRNSSIHAPQARIGADALEPLMHRVAIGEDMMRRFPNPRARWRCRTGRPAMPPHRQANGRDHRTRLRQKPRSESGDDCAADRRPGAHAPAPRAVTTGSPPAAAAKNEPIARGAARRTGNEICGLAPLGRFFCAARRRPFGRQRSGRQRTACSQPIRSRHSNALLMKSRECPLSAKMRSVSAANRRSASIAGRAPAAMAVSSVRCGCLAHAAPRSSAEASA